MVKIAYFIMAHHKMDLFERMLNALYSPQHLYLVHIDSKADPNFYQEVQELAKLNSNLHLLPSRSLTWGLWSLVQCELDAIDYLLKTDQEWSHFINLSGQDFPLVKQSYIENFLKNNKNNYVRCLPLNENPALKSHHQGNYFIEDCGRLKNMGPREPFESYFSEGIDPYFGSQWKILHRPFAEYAAASYMSFEMQDYFRYTLIPDECFFPTLIMNSPFKETVVNENYRYFKMKNHHEVLLSPTVLTTADVMDMYRSPAFFARKFDLDIDSNVIDMIENVLQSN